MLESEFAQQCQYSCRIIGVITYCDRTRRAVTLKKLADGIVRYPEP